MSENDNSFDSLLNLEESTPEEEGKEEKEKESPEDKQKLLEEKHTKLEESYKNLQEFNRQRSEEVKELKDWKNKITGLDEVEKKKEIELELNKKYNEDPLSVISDMIDKRLGTVEEKMQTNQIANSMDRIMSKIEEDYDINWDRDKDKILTQLEYFSPKAKQEKSEEVLLSACRLAGVLKPKEKSTSPMFVEGSEVNSLNKSVANKESTIIKKGILAQKTKKIL